MMADIFKKIVTLELRNLDHRVEKRFFFFFAKFHNNAPTHKVTASICSQATCFLSHLRETNFAHVSRLRSTYRSL